MLNHQILRQTRDMKFEILFKVFDGDICHREWWKESTRRWKQKSSSSKRVFCFSNWLLFIFCFHNKTVDIAGWLRNVPNDEKRLQNNYLIKVLLDHESLTSDWEMCFNSICTLHITWPAQIKAFQLLLMMKTRERDVILLTFCPDGNRCQSDLMPRLIELHSQTFISITLNPWLFCRLEVW